MDAIPANGIERIEMYKTLAADQDADGVGGTINLVTPSAQDKPTYELNGTAGYSPLPNGFWRGGFDGTFGHRWGANKKFGLLVGGTWDRTNRGINDLEPSQGTGTAPDGSNIAVVTSEDQRSYNYYRTRYGFDLDVDEKITPTMSVYLKGLYSDFHDFGETTVYTPSGSNMIASASGGTVKIFTPAECATYNLANGTADNPTPCTDGNWAYREYIRRPAQQVFSFLSGATHDLPKDEITYDVAVSRGHNIGGNIFRPPTSGPTERRVSGRSERPLSPEAASDRRN